MVTTRRSVLALIVHGDRVAYGNTRYDPADGADNVVIWSMRGGPTRHVDAPCGNYMFELALGATEVAWVCWEAGDLNELDLYSWRPGTHAVQVATMGTNELGMGLQGDGHVLVFNTYVWNTLRAQKLWRLVGAQKLLLRSGSGSILAASVDAGRIALRRPDGSVALLTVGGDLIRVLPSLARHADTVLLNGPHLVLARRGAVEQFDLHGRLLRRWPVRSQDWELSDAFGEFAAYVAGAAVHVLRLSDGRELVFAPGREKGATLEDAPPLVQLDHGRLFYSYNLSRRRNGRIAVVPLRAIDALLG